MISRRRSERLPSMVSKGIDVFYEDLGYSSPQIHRVDRPSSDQTLSATRHTRKTSDEVSLTFIGLEPLFFYEALPDREQHAVLVR
jgi:hypothetical protein